MLSAKLLVCKKCLNSTNNSVSLSKQRIYRYLHEVQCTRCSLSWLVCSVHDKRFARSCYFRAKKHLEESDHSMCFPINMNRNLPINNNNKSIDNILNDNMSFDSNSTEVVNNNDHINNNYQSESSDSDSIMINRFEESKKDLSLECYNNTLSRYIEVEVNVKGDGIKRLVACAFAMNSNANHSDLPYKEAIYHLKATLLCYSLTASQRNHFSDLSYMIGTTFNPSFSHVNGLLQTRLPSSSIDIDRYYLNRSTSIATNIPIPKVEEMDDHAYISIKEAIQHFLCFETNIDGMFTKSINSNYKNLVFASSPMTNSAISHIIRTKVKERIRNTDLTPLILYIILWSDDFEPNHVKQHKKSTWLKTVTISPPNDRQTSPRHTYVIAMARKDKNHEIMNSYFYDELKELKNPTYMYCKATNSYIPIIIETLAISADRPERSGLNCMLGHNGIPTRRWRYSAYINHKETKSCVSCWKRRIHLLCQGSELSSIPITCTECSDWDYNSPNMGHDRPKDYPESAHPHSPPPPPGHDVDGPSLLFPVELTYPFMKQGVQYCFHQCYHGNWTRANAIVYLKSIGVNEKYGKEFVLDMAQTLKNIPSTDEDQLNDYIVFPSIWNSGISLNQCIDTPMHLLFQGIMKTIMDETSTWLSGKVTAQYKDFGDYANSTLSELHDTGLDWCRMEKFMSGRLYSTGGWQAEQYVAFARCMIIVYSSIRDIVGNDEVGIDEHECMMQALLCMISRFMTGKDVCHMILLDYVKCFLSACDRFENTAFTLEKVDPMWCNKGNFLSLLNLPMQVKTFGKLRLFWEGSRERSIQQIKPFLKKVRSTSSFYKTKLHHMYVTQSLKNLSEDGANEIGKEDPKYITRRTYERYLSFKIYSEHKDLLNHLDNHDILSTIIIKRDTTEIHYVCQKGETKERYVIIPIRFCDEDGFNKCGMWYAPIMILKNNTLGTFTKKELNDMAHDFGLLCPCISKYPSLRACYTAFTKDWYYRTNLGSHELPVLSKEFFLNTIL